MIFIFYIKIMQLIIGQVNKDYSLKSNFQILTNRRPLLLN
jgi:hypothetical protein